MQRSLTRNTKGALALLVAAVLLLAGYGSYAYWSSSVSLNGGAINSGQLALTGTGAGVWRDASLAQPGTVIPNIANFLIVPGDTLTYTVTRTVRAQGNNLTATLAANPASVTGDAALLAATTISTAITINGTAATAVTSANDGESVTAIVTFAFSTAATNATQLQNLNLSNLTLTLTQNPR